VRALARRERRSVLVLSEGSGRFVVANLKELEIGASKPAISGIGLKLRHWLRLVKA
jgi:hypothetical protein